VKIINIIYIYIFIYIYIYIYIYICIYIYIYIYTYTYIYIYIQQLVDALFTLLTEKGGTAVSIYIIERERDTPRLSNLCIYNCTYVYIYVYMYNMYIYIHICIYPPTYIARYRARSNALPVF